MLGTKFDYIRLPPYIGNNIYLTGSQFIKYNLDD